MLPLLERQLQGVSKVRAVQERGRRGGGEGREVQKRGGRWGEVEEEEDELEELEARLRWVGVVGGLQGGGPAGVGPQHGDQGVQEAQEDVASGEAAEAGRALASKGLGD